MAFFKGQEFDYQDPRWKEFENEFPKIKRFLSDIHGLEVTRCNWRAVDKGKFPRSPFSYGSVTFNWVMEKIFVHNKTGYEIFFSLSPYEWYDIKKTKNKRRRLKQWRPMPKRSFVIDVDCGPEEEAKISALANVQNLCQKRFAPYTHLVRSRNGFQIYWTISEGVDDKIWVAVQKRLIQIFNSDPAIHNSKQDLRLPCMYHWKGNKEGFYVDVEFENVGSYTLQQFLYAIGLDKEKIESVSPTPSVETFEFIPKPKIPTSPPRNPELYQEVGRILGVACRSKPLIYHYMNIKEGKTTGIRCPFHKDEKPSAGIYLHSNGHYIFSCRSSKCLKSGDILKIVKANENIDDELHPV